MLSYYQLLVDEFSSEGANRGEGTAEWYEDRLTPFFQFIENQGVAFEDVSAREVNMFFTWMNRPDEPARKKPFAWSTRNGTYTALQNFCGWAIERDYLKQNPFRSPSIVARPRKPVQLKTCPTLETILLILKAIKAEAKVQAKRDYAMFLVMLDGGIRRMEVVNLNISDIDFSCGKVYVRVAKNGDQRTARIEPYVCRAIQEWLCFHPFPNDPDAPLFTVLQGKTKHNRLNQKTVNGLLRTWSKQAGLSKHAKPHDLRRIFASHFANTGGNVAILMEFLGHKDLETTLTYIITTESEKRMQHKQHSPMEYLEKKLTEDTTSNSLDSNSSDETPQE